MFEKRSSALKPAPPVPVWFLLGLYFTVFLGDFPLFSVLLFCSSLSSPSFTAPLSQLLPFFSTPFLFLSPTSPLTFLFSQLLCLFLPSG